LNSSAYGVGWKCAGIPIITAKRTTRDMSNDAESPITVHIGLPSATDLVHQPFDMAARLAPFGTGSDGTFTVK